MSRIKDEFKRLLAEDAGDAVASVEGEPVKVGERVKIKPDYQKPGMIDGAVAERGSEAGIWKVHFPGGKEGWYHHHFFQKV
jgi:hypothetical protein